MCLYQLKLRNPHYLRNEKNRGIIPKPNDDRHLYINTNCGWCIECRKELANNWRNRLQEEWKSNKNVEFVTLSYSAEAIKQLRGEIIRKHYKGLNAGEIDVNQLAAYSIRMWSERWRKKYKKAPYKWLITELGHKNSERLHLHGLIWRPNNETKAETQQSIKDTWKYGNVWCGQYVNERSFNYITKYITKLDQYHKGYKQKIFTSHKMGIGYIYRMAIHHQFAYERTITYYTNHQGLKFSLPKYWKNKLWTEQQREWLWSYALNQNKQRINGTEYEMDKTTPEEFEKALAGARESNILAGFGDNRTCNRKYIITPVMMMTYKEILNYDRKKMVKSVKRRNTEKIINYTEKNYTLIIDNGKLKKEYINTTLDKTLNVDQVIYGEYIGNLTDSEQKFNREFREAQKEKLTVRQWRLKQKGLPY